MKSLIVYDSLYGNTEKVAHAVARAMQSRGKVEVKAVGQVKPLKLVRLELLVIGTPTHGGRPTPAIQSFLKQIPATVLQSTFIACFDTRIAPEDVGFWLKLLIKTIGYAAPKMTKTLKVRGAKHVKEPEGFIVIGKEGPLRKGELERATTWTNSIR